MWRFPEPESFMPERHVLGETKQQNQIGSEISFTERRCLVSLTQLKTVPKATQLVMQISRKSGKEDTVVARGAGHHG